MTRYTAFKLLTELNIKVDELPIKGRCTIIVSNVGEAYKFSTST